MAFFGVEINAQVNRLMGQIKLTLNKNQYLPNFRTIYRSMANFDTEQTGHIQLHQFDKALQQNGIFLKKYEVQVFQKAFEEDGMINWFNFMQILREPLNAYRMQTIENVYNTIDPDNAGQIHCIELSKLFNPSNILEFKLQQKNKQTIEKQLFSLVPLTPEGYITKEQFINFYSDLSINILSDNTFRKFLCNQWGCDFKPLPPLSAEQIKEAIKIVRFKLIQMTEGTHEEYILKQVFDEFDIDRSGNLCKKQLHTMLIKLEMPTEQRLVNPLLQKLDVSKNGLVEFDEFKNFLFFDPYPI